MSANFEDILGMW